MKIKICGMKFPHNIQEIAQLNIDFMGFICYNKSKRDVTNSLDLDSLASLPKYISKVGVFVDEKIEIIEELKNKYALDFIQLHGEESANDCQALKDKGMKIIKAFGISPEFDFNTLLPYQTLVDYFLFDTKGILKGGNGEVFDWQILANYSLSVPFFLSGGIGLTNIAQALAFKHPQLAGVDLNSQLELAPGLKSVLATNEIIKKIRHDA